MSQQLRVFVSHSHEDDSFCQTLVQALRDAGADVWYDEHNMGSGRLGPTIERELRDRPVFVVILSPAALRSHWVEDETRWAYGLLRKEASRLIQPVTAAPISEDDIWLFLQDFKRIEAPGAQPLPLEEAVWHILRALALTSNGEARATAAPRPVGSSEALIARGKALNAQGKYTEALPLLEPATQLAPKSFDAWANLGYTLSELERWQEAVVAYARATTLGPDDAIAWNKMGDALYNLERYEEALAAYDQSLALDANDPEVWYNKGFTLENLGRYVEALAAYERGFDPNDASDWDDKARCLRALGRTAEAEAAEQRADELGG